MEIKHGEQSWEEVNRDWKPTPEDMLQWDAYNKTD